MVALDLSFTLNIPTISSQCLVKQISRAELVTEACQLLCSNPKKPVNEVHPNHFFLIRRHVALDGFSNRFIVKKQMNSRSSRPEWKQNLYRHQNAGKSKKGR